MNSESSPLSAVRPLGTMITSRPAFLTKDKVPRLSRSLHPRLFLFLEVVEKHSENA